MPHSPGLSNNSYPDPNHFKIFVFIPISLRFITVFFNHIRLGLYRYLFPMGLSLSIFKEILFYSILAASSGHVNILDFVILTKLGEWYKL